MKNANKENIATQIKVFLIPILSIHGVKTNLMIIDIPLRTKTTATKASPRI